MTCRAVKCFLKQAEPHGAPIGGVACLRGLWHASFTARTANTVCAFPCGQRNLQERRSKAVREQRPRDDSIWPILSTGVVLRLSRREESRIVLTALPKPADARLHASEVRIAFEDIAVRSRMRPRLIVRDDQKNVRPPLHRTASGCTFTGQACQHQNGWNA